MGHYIAMAGRKQKKKYGIEYGWNSTMFTIVENFGEECGFDLPKLNADKSCEKISTDFEVESYG